MQEFSSPSPELVSAAVWEYISTTSPSDRPHSKIRSEKYDFEILDDGIYQNDVKLGEVGCTDGGWWFTRATDETEQQQPCDSALDAVWWLSMVDVLPHAEAADCEELLDRPFEMLTAQD
ncbi:hypothetical protein LC613_34475 [Nostoc sphaeroides CHAB 2801]|uniref:hypothetical protein n=1 Tax=Nostoc sphaeroides TaxID=446679 RepID=UPI001E365E6D|nr:hypothetical protein [Nostoc sphaeroides]MCC5632702.1 hypothetical protein [Nostoc sphaeroides CHAB 2801]